MHHLRIGIETEDDQLFSCTMHASKLESAILRVVNQSWSKGGSRSMKKRDFESKRGSFQEIVQIQQIGAKWSKFS